MSSARLHGGLATLCLLLSCHTALAVGPTGPPPAASPPASATGVPTTVVVPTNIGPSDLASPTTGAYPVALPVTSTGEAPLLDASGFRKFFTITAALRETYDDNVYTTENNKQASLETELSPSILANIPLTGGSISGRYTMDLTYYSPVGSTSQTGNPNSLNNSLQVTHEFIASYTHAFSDRFNLNLGEQFRYYTNPSIYESVGSNYYNGAYVSNVLNGVLTAQWTPLLGSSTSYSNTIVRYDDASVAEAQDDIENTVSHSFSLTILPTVSASAGGIVDEIDYKDSRGYISYTGFGGIQWQPTPDLSLSARAGASYTENNQVPGTPTQPGSFSPYAALAATWTTGMRSSVGFSYSHEVSPSDEVNANGQLSDRFSLNGSYNITPSLTASLQSTLTVLTVSQSLINSGINSYSETDYGFGPTLDYHVNSHLDFTTGLNLTGVSSQLEFLNYTRDQYFLGIRGTY